MKIRDILQKDRPTISFEVFPPKTMDNYASVEKATMKIAELQPDFMSITYGAGGGTSAYTIDIAANLMKTYNVSSTKEKVHEVLGQMKDHGIENVLALRGDIPAASEFPLPGQYHYAAELIEDIKSQGDFCIGAACYPEGHVEAPNQREDMRHLKEKVDAGCDFLTTQMFFDNSVMYSFLYQIREMGITVPVLAGVMPVTNKKQIKRSCELSGTYLPTRFKRMVDKFGDDPASMKQAGIAYATEQIIDLIANGVKGIHVYSMNKPEIAQAVMHNLSEILK